MDKSKKLIELLTQISTLEIDSDFPACSADHMQTIATQAIVYAKLFDEVCNVARSSSDINKIKKMIGPSQDQINEHKENIERFEAIEKANGYNHPSLSHIGSRISEFEEIYG